MAVKITKPEINVREKLAELDKPSGIAGEAMLRAETVAEQQALIGVGRRNLLINGGFDVWQRGTSFTPTGGNPYTADRWRVYQSSTSNVTVTKGTESTSSSVPFINYIRLDDTIDADTSWIELNQYVEDYSHLINNTVTVSFWAKASYNIQDGYIYTNAGTTSGAYAITTSWTKYQVTLDLKAGTVASDGYLRLLLGTQTLVAADSYIDYAQVQLELGKVATPFEHRSYGEELALCQRYFYATETSKAIMGHVMYNNENRIALPAIIAPMRATPSITAYTSNRSASGQLTEFSSGVSRAVNAVSGASKLGGGYIQASSGNWVNLVYLILDYDAEL